MPDIRRDPISNRWVIFAPDRVARPISGELLGLTEDTLELCPFCEGSESITPREILAYRNHGSRNEPGWRVRVVANKFPALHVEGQLDPEGVGLYDRTNGIGAHEVIIESPDHLTDFADLPDSHAGEVFLAARDRIRDLRGDVRLKVATLFKNRGSAAGASLTHTHSQLIATPFVPPDLRSELDAAEVYYAQRERCLFCDLLRQELRDGSRVVMETPDFVVFCPYASRFAFETWVMPKKHESRFENLAPMTTAGLGWLTRDLLRALNEVAGRPAYNFVLHSAPISGDELPSYHWHLEILPRIARAAGFEFGTGSYINTVLPEDAARSLAEAMTESASIG